ncbi:MAG: hypothetical protein EOP04_00730 [Proteobacteria bacterium]|nr:MAG: hypothetical protein EOP04_00730 [Pseudomonadota bacterium]
MTASAEFAKKLKSRSIEISMDGKGRAIDNIFTERLWRTMKYENVFLRGYQSMVEASDGLKEYLAFENDERLRGSLGYQTPNQVYSTSIEVAHISVGTYPLKKAA